MTTGRWAPFCGVREEPDAVHWDPPPDHVVEFDEAAWDCAPRDRWESGAPAWFEYHCLMSGDSHDYHLWQRTQQPVTVRGIEPGSDDVSDEFPTARERGEEAGMPLVYEVEFADGFQAAVFEDELLTGPQYFQKCYAFIPSNRGVQG